MKDRPPAWPGQPYLDELRPERGETVRLALFATYSVDLSAIAATLLALIGRNNEKGSGAAIDFAEAVDQLRDRVRIIIQRGRIARPVVLPRVAGILDQFVVEQTHDERVRSWHPKIALVAYEGPKVSTRWKLWIGSRNLTRSQDLEVGVLLGGHARCGKGRTRLEGIGGLGASLARAAGRADALAISEELEAVWWEAPEGFMLRALLDGLEDGATLAVEPPAGAIDGITIVSPFLSPDFLKMAGRWGPAGARTLVSSMPALVDMANRSGAPLAAFSHVFAYAAPDEIIEEKAPEATGASTPDDDEAEPQPLALHAKLVAFHQGNTTTVRVGSANATDRAWAGRNSEVMIELEASEAFNPGLAFLIGKATPVTIDELARAKPANVSEADALNESRKALTASWNPILRRDGDRFVLDARTAPQLADTSHRLSAGHANGDLLAWPEGGNRLDLGVIPLSIQSAFIQVRVCSAEDSVQWMQRVTVDPPLDEKRDLAALASHMGLRAFHGWMRAMLGGETVPIGDVAWDEDRSAKEREALVYTRLTLEDILTAWARDEKAFARVDKHFTPYVEALLAHDGNLTPAEKKDLNELAQIWAIARTRLASS
ncbi:phospholipase D family protein [Aminobacter anthyllidis]|uniref:phospholipase D family protein n=1 Tax=Aminobacter anthyllidis TaxID=1035067 RepID=UPI00245854CA|nr:phospholipase D family protein [Aminobacter anthyllidis]MDH4986919.1 phospholipase D family protein [Aminobacter anthyllidis]